MKVDSFDSIPAAFVAISNQSAELTVYSQPERGDFATAEELHNSPPRKWNNTTFKQVRARIAGITNLLLKEGIDKGERVAIIAQTRPEWMECDIAILSAGGVTVSVYPSLTANEIGYILFDSSASIVVAENQEQINKLLKLAAGSFPIPGTEERPATTATISVRKIIAIEQCQQHPLVVQLSTLTEPENETTFSRIPSIRQTDIATLVYTSGTTGAPKGVIQTHRNHLSNIRQAFRSGMFSSDSSLMLFLPLAHSFAKLMGYIGFLTSATLKFPAIWDSRSSKFDPVSVSKDLQESGAHIFPVVPRLLEKMQSGVLEKAHKGGLGGLLVSATLRFAAELAHAKEIGKLPSLTSQLGAMLTASIRRSIKKKLFGLQFQYAVSGGAKLPIDVLEFFDALEIEVLEGYGLTETCVATNVNRAGKKRIGSVGPVLDADIEVSIAADGEIKFRGPNVALGYWNRPTATSAAWSADGWFATGDLGEVDQDGYLWIRGRKKELIITSGGKKIPPEQIEQRIKECECVSQAMLVGEGKPYCAALVTINEPIAKAWAAKKGIALAAQLNNDKQLYEYIWGHVERVNKELASYESVKKIVLLPEDFTQENTLLTPTFKVRRSEVAKRYATEIEQLFA